MTALDLKPCPFCGGEAEIWRAHEGRTAWIACMGRCAVLVSKEYTTDAEAIAVWNTRASPAAMTPDAELIARLHRPWPEDENVEEVTLPAWALELTTKAARRIEADAAALAEAQAEIAALEAKLARLVGALDMSRQGWRNALELDLLPRQHRHSAKTMADVSDAALTEVQARDEGAKG